jgi:hypothetical protein
VLLAADIATAGRFFTPRHLDAMLSMNGTESPLL